MFLEALSHIERSAATLFRAGIGTVLLFTSADGAIHAAGWHDLEQAAHLGIFAGMAFASIALIVRGSAPQRKERSHAVR